MRLLGKELRAPLLIAAMTGGHERAADINRALASIANELGFAFGLGSQRAMQKDPKTSWTYQVRDDAPDALVFGNVGIVQARDMPTGDIRRMVEAVGAGARVVDMDKGAGGHLQGRHRR